MAHKNIDARRAWLKERLGMSHKITIALVEEASALFGCSSGTIRTDWQVLNIERNRAEAKTLSGQTSLTSTVKDFVTSRDRNICQYCE